MNSPTLDQLSQIQSQLETLDLSSVSDATVSNLVKALWNGMTPLSVDLDHNRIWYRARRCKDHVPFNNLDELIYNNNGCTGYGRAQVAGSKVLYAGWNENVALDEIERKPGDLIQIIAIRPRMGAIVPCFAVGEVVGFRNSNRSQFGSTETLTAQLEKLGNDFRLVAYRDAVIAHYFRKRVEHSYEYKVTAAFSEIFHGVGGLIFPSVQTPYAYNLAINNQVFDKQFEVIATMVLKIISAPGHGIYHAEKHSFCHDFLPDGTINWGSPMRRDLSFPSNFGMHEVTYQAGWRKL